MRSARESVDRAASATENVRAEAQKRAHFYASVMLSNDDSNLLRREPLERNSPYTCLETFVSLPTPKMHSRPTSCVYVLYDNDEYVQRGVPSLRYRAHSLLFSARRLSELLIFGPIIQFCGMTSPGHP